MMRYFASTGAKQETEKIAKIINTLHIAPAPSGIWIDQLDGNGLPCSTDIAASVFYHIVRAIDAASQMMADTP